MFFTMSQKQKPTTTTSSKPHSASAVASADEVYTKTDADADVVTPRPPVTTTTSAPSGLDLLFSASQVHTKPKAEAADVAAEEASPTPTIAVISDGDSADGRCGSNRGTDDASSAQSDSENLALAAAVATRNDVKSKSFPEILHEILATEEYQSIIHWLPDGYSFIIADKQKFSQVILPKYFRVALFYSFVRKLNRWGFRKVKSHRKGEESSFAHIDFVRDKPWQCLTMKCKSKPSYHKVFPVNKKIMATAPLDAVSEAPLSFLPMGGTVDTGRAFVEPLSLPERPFPTTTPTITTITGSPTTSVAAATSQERQFLASIHEYKERILRERQIHMLQMHQRQQIQAQAQLHLVNNLFLPLLNEERFDFANSFAPNSLTAQYTRDMLRRNIFN